MRMAVVRFLGMLLAGAAVAPALNAEPPPASPTMPAAQQTELIQTYCAVCHQVGTFNNGGLSLKNFDAARIDPTLAVMLVGKLRNGALGAAGLPMPDKATEQRLTAALEAAGQGSDLWFATPPSDPDGPSVSIVRQIVDAKHTLPNLFRLTLHCDPATREGTMQLTWAVNTPAQDLEISAAWDEAPAKAYKLPGTTKMIDGKLAPPAIVVLATSREGALALPARSLTVSRLPGDLTVSFPFGDLPASARGTLASCMRPTF